MTYGYVDGRKARAWWHEQAKQMKRDGASISDIATKFERSHASVVIATKGIESLTAAKNRMRRGKVASGFEAGRLRRISISFTPEQVDRINALCSKEGASFSLVVSKLVDIATSKTEGA